MTEEQLNKHIEEFDKKFWDGLNCLITLDPQPEDSNWRRAAKSEDIKAFFTTKLKQAFKQGEEKERERIIKIVEKLDFDIENTDGENDDGEPVDFWNLIEINKVVEAISKSN